MKCEKCGKNEATTYYKETINGQTREMRLCAACAQEMQLGTSFESAFAGLVGGMNTLWSNPFQTLTGGSPLSAGTKGAQRACPTCGMTEGALRRAGRAGCADCYRTFADILAPYIRQIHGADSHLGSKPAEEAPSAASPSDALRDRLQQAVEREDYEEAARLRDEIRRLEGEQA